MPCNIPGNIVRGKQSPKPKEQDMGTINSATSIHVPWNKGKLVGQKAPFKLKEIWAIRVRLGCRRDVYCEEVDQKAEFA
jgi:hypothetical protein